MRLKRQKRILFTDGVAEATYRCDTCDIETIRTVKYPYSPHITFGQIRISRSLRGRSSKILESPKQGRSALIELGALQFLVQADRQIIL